MASNPSGYRFTVHPAQGDEDRPVVALVPEGEKPARRLEEAIAHQGLDHRGHWFVLRCLDDLFKVEWFEAEFNCANGRLDRLRPLHGARTEAEAVEAVQARYRKRREEIEARWPETEEKA